MKVYQLKDDRNLMLIKDKLNDKWKKKKNSTETHHEHKIKQETQRKKEVDKREEEGNYENPRKSTKIMNWRLKRKWKDSEALKYK